MPVVLDVAFDGVVTFRRVFLGLTAVGVAAAVVFTVLVDNAKECSASALTPTTEPSEPLPSSTEPSTTQPTPISPEEAAALGKAVTDAIDDVVPGTDIGLMVYDRLTESTVASVNDDSPFYTASVVKLLIGIHILHDADWTIPTGKQREALVTMLSHSHDSIASMLWHSNGAAAIIHETAELIDLSHTLPPNNPRQWELTRMSAHDVLQVYTYIGQHMPPSAGEFLRGALAAAPARAADGFHQYFGIPDAMPDAERAIKQGWMRVNNGLVLNTTGFVGPEHRYIVVLLTQQPLGSDFDAGQEAVTAGIEALTPALATDM